MALGLGSFNQSCGNQAIVDLFVLVDVTFALFLVSIAYLFVDRFYKKRDARLTLNNAALAIGFVSST